MSYQKVLQPQFFYENPEYFDEAESFIETVSYSESDGFIGFPMVRTVPSYDIQELYIKKPLVTTSQILPVQQRSRRYLSGQHAFNSEYFCELQPRIPPHLKTAQKANLLQSSSRIPQKSDNTHRSISMENQQQTIKPKKDGNIFKSSPSLSLRTKISTSHDETKEYPREHRTRRSARPSTPMPRRNLSCFSEPFTNRQELSLQIQHPQKFGKFEEIELLQEHITNSSKYVNHPVISSGEDLKKPNSEGDASGYTNINELDTISRIAATLDVDEAGKLSNKQRMEIKEMSKFLIPRVPSSVQSLQEHTVKKKSETLKESEKRIEEKRDNKEKFGLSFRKSLDSVISQLENCESSLNAVKSKLSMNRSDPQTAEKITTKADCKEDIFNLREISCKLNRASEEKKYEKGEGAIKSVDADNLNSNDESTDSESRYGCGESLDSTSAVELHRSKSYIVNLIDRALSKELGTLTNKDSGRGLDPLKAIKRIEKSRKMEKLDTSMNSSLKQECEPPSSYPKAEGHTYIRQLKELRWGHFRHIQQEVKRLEDLERFLDHCSTSDNSTV